MESTKPTESSEELIGGSIVEKKIESFDEQEKLIKETFNEKQIAVYHELKQMAEALIKEKFDEGHFEAAQKKFLAPDTLQRFLYAREFKIKETYEMYKNSVQWNIEYKPEEIQAESIKGLLMSQRWITFGRDKKGRATLIVRPRFHNVDEFPMDQMLRYGIFMVEKAIRLTESYGHKQYVVILDRHGVQRAN